MCACHEPCRRILPDPLELSLTEVVQIHVRKGTPFSPAFAVVEVILMRLCMGFLARSRASSTSMSPLRLALVAADEACLELKRAERCLSRTVSLQRALPGQVRRRGRLCSWALETQASSSRW